MICRLTRSLWLGLPLFLLAVGLGNIGWLLWLQSEQGTRSRQKGGTDGFEMPVRLRPLFTCGVEEDLDLSSFATS